MRGSLALTLAACSILTLAAPFFPGDTPPLFFPISSKKIGSLDNCPGYAASNVVKTNSSLTADLTLAGAACNLYSPDIKDLKLEVEYQNAGRLHVKIYDAAMQVFQVQDQVFPRPRNDKHVASDAALEFDIVESPFSFTVKRKDNGEVLFDTSAAQFIFEEQYVRLRTSLPQSPNIYGLGEHSDSFRFDSNGYQRVLLNSESPSIPEKSNLYGTHPVYFDHRGDKGTHGVFLLSSSPMNIDLTKDGNGNQYLEYNTIGGIIDLYFMPGPSPTEVSQQYAEVIGFSAMYPYWTLGFHQCRFGYWDVNMVAEVVSNYSTAGIPLEVMWTDIDYMNLRQDFTTDNQRFPVPKVRELVNTLHQRDQRYVLILDPGVMANETYDTYKRGHELDVFLKHADGTELLGIQWPGAVVWPDWFAPNTPKWWIEEIINAFSADSGIDLDGLWVDMNEASNFCDDQFCKPREKAIQDGVPPPPANAPRPNTGRYIPGFPASFQPSSSKSLQTRNSKALTTRKARKMKGLEDREWFYPKYHINSHRGELSQFTIYTNTSNYDGSRQYDTHNFYGHMMAMTTHEAMLARRPKIRPFVLTRSTFANSGHKVAHWFGDNFSSWDHYLTSIRQMLSFVSMHQMPLVGSDVCGFNGDTNEQLCARWAVLGAFQPFYRNHAELSTIPQEFYRWPIVAEAAKKAIDTRYRLLDYLYTALYSQSITGEPMIYPLFFLYPSDPNTFGIENQWFFGDALLISPVTVENATSASFYLPADTFYDYWTHAKVQGGGTMVTATNLTLTDIPVHIRGGSIIPQRVNSANTTKALRKQDFVILVAPNDAGTAQGLLYLDDGESIEQSTSSEISFTFEAGNLKVTGSWGYQGAGGESVTVRKVTVLGQTKPGAVGEFDDTRGAIDIEGDWKLTGEWELQL